MISFQNILPAIADFLKGAQEHGLVKEFSLNYSEINDDILSSSEASQILAKFLETVNETASSTEQSVQREITTEEIQKMMLKGIESIESDPPVESIESDPPVESIESDPPVEPIEAIESNPPVESVEVTENDPPVESIEVTESDPPVESIEVAESDPPVDKSLIQIQVDENEMKRRITAFTSRKRKEVDEWNVQEFCNRPYLEEQNPAWEEINTCARVDAVFIPRCGSKSHVKVSKVENRWGPQTQLHVEKRIKQEPNSEDCNLQNDATIQAIEERLNSMEDHLKIKTEGNIRRNIFQRLKELENRIIFLEGISTDYFHLSDTDYPSPRKRNSSDLEKTYSNWSFDEVQKRIQSLKESLIMKTKIKTERSE